MKAHRYLQVGDLVVNMRPHAREYGKPGLLIGFDRGGKFNLVDDENPGTGGDALVKYASGEVARLCRSSLEVLSEAR
jgi:hypothetical protein